MKAVIQFDIPVQVTVDLDTGKVDDVTEWRSEWGSVLWPVIQAPDGDSLDKSQEEQAIEIAESTDWPEWNVQ